MTEIEIRKKLKTDGVNLNVFELVDSTNTVLRNMANDGYGEKTVVIANEQTHGRGRKGRNFFSPSDSGIYMSILLRPQSDIKDAVLITSAAAVCVARAIDKVCGVKSEIKWVNDIYINNKKVCGILAESALDSKTASVQYIILGIGVNLYQPKNDFPSEIQNIAASVLENKQNVDLRDSLVAEIVDEFFSVYPNVSDKKIYNEYKNRLMLIGKDVIVYNAEKQYEATVVDLDDSFRLCVKTKSGEEIRLNSGEVSTKLS